MTTTQLVIVFSAFATPLVAGIVLLFFKLSQLHAQMNSRLDELVKVTRTQALAEGHLAGVVEGESQRRKNEEKSSSLPSVEPGASDVEKL